MVNCIKRGLTVHQDYTEKLRAEKRSSQNREHQTKRERQGSKTKSSHAKAKANKNDRPFKKSLTRQIENLNKNQEERTLRHSHFPPVKNDEVGWHSPKLRRNGCLMSNIDFHSDEDVF